MACCNGSYRMWRGDLVRSLWEACSIFSVMFVLSVLTRRHCSVQILDPIMSGTCWAFHRSGSGPCDCSLSTASEHSVMATLAMLPRAERPRPAGNVALFQVKHHSTRLHCSTCLWRVLQQGVTTCSSGSCVTIQRKRSLLCDDFSHHIVHFDGDGSVAAPATL